MTDANNSENDGRFDSVDDPGDYNPESIDYEAQDNDSNQEAGYPSDEASHEETYDPRYVVSTSQSIGPPPPPAASLSPIATRPPALAHSPSASRSPAIPRQYDTAEVQEGSPPIQDAIVNNKSPPTTDVDDNHAIPEQDHPPQEQSALPKSVDLQALLAGLVPARTKVQSNSPPQTHDAPPPQSFPSGGPAPPHALNLPPDIMYQLQSLTSPPPQTAPSFQHPPPVQQQSGPIDIQPEDLVLTPQEEHLYEKFIQNEREVVQNARWDEFTPGSRMFIGNLPSDKIGKKDIFRLFYPYGRLAQISIKQAYGFVQFYDKADCDRAIHAQQGMIITGRKVHLEVSKPQKPKDGGEGGRGRRNRSPFGRDRDRSPPSARGGRGRARGKSGLDDFESRGRPGSRDFSPPSRRYGRDDDYGRRYSRSRSPPARFPGSPRRGAPEPPEVALLVKDDPDRGYIHYVEDMFEDRRIRTDTVFVSPRASIPDLTRQMVLDGILAVVFLSRPLQDRRKVSMQTFQRNPTDPGAVKWDEYNEVEVPAAVDLVVALKRGPQQPPPFTGYPPQYPPAQPAALPTGVNPNLANIIGNMNPAALQKVFGAIAQQPPPVTPAATTYGGYGAQAAGGGQGVLGQGNVLQGYGGQRPAQPTQQVQDIMAQLAALSRKG